MTAAWLRNHMRTKGTGKKTVAKGDLDITSSGVTPAAVMKRATRFDQVLRSCLVANYRWFACGADDE